jgi:hypothetical protein
MRMSLVKLTFGLWTVVVQFEFLGNQMGILIALWGFEVNLREFRRCLPELVQDTFDRPEISNCTTTLWTWNFQGRFIIEQL